MWVHINKDQNGAFRQAIAEIDTTQSDRAAAIVAGTFVEDHLTEYVRWRLVHEDKLQNELFRVSGPLGNFGVKIDLGYLMRLYSKEAWKELDTIKEIRNSFAHKMEVADFKNDRMRGLSDNLKMWEQKPIVIGVPAGGLDVGGIVQLAFISEFVEGPGQALMFKPPPEGKPVSARERFINACKFHIAAIGITIHLVVMEYQPVF